MEDAWDRLYQEYWEEVQRTRCRNCGLTLGLHEDDCIYNDDIREEV